jgi:hypothetical protein
MRYAGIVALALPGCSALVEQDWHESPEHPPLTPYHLVVSDEGMEKACGSHPWMHVFGCAVRVPSENACFVYTRSQPAAWLIEHENRHCGGWDHGRSQAP